MAEKTEAERNAWNAGFGIACAELAKTHGEGVHAAYLIRDAGLTLDDFRAAGIEHDDIATLQDAMAQVRQGD